MKSKSKKLSIPIFNVVVYIVICDNIYKERNKKQWVDMFGNLLYDDIGALCSYNHKGKFGLFFTFDNLFTRVITHEVFHLTHRILEYINSPFCKELHEVGAQLNGYLNTEIQIEINKMYKKGSV